MDINYSKILAEKKSHDYSSMATDSVVNFTKRMDSLLTESSDVIKKYLPDIVKNKLGESFIRYYSLTENMDGDDISNLLENISEDNSCRDFLTAIKSYKDTNAYVKNEVLYEFASRRFNSTCLYESTYCDELELIGYNINTSPETIDRYAKLLTRIETDDYGKVCASFPDLLKKNTSIVLGMRIVVSGQVANMIVSLPIIISKRLINEGTSKQQREFIKIIDTNMRDMRAMLSAGDARHYNFFIAYLDNLDMARTELTNTIAKSVKESAVFENIADMQPDIVAYEEAVIEDPIAELEDMLSSIVFDDDEISEESMVRVARAANQINHLYYVSEGKLIRKAANKIERASSKVVSKLDAIKKDNDATKASLNKAVSPFATAFAKFIDDAKAKDLKERRERIITNEFSRKLTNYIKKGIKIIIAGGAGALGGIHGLVIAAIGIAIYIIKDKHTDIKMKRTIIHELETELAIVNEKLDDSRNDSDKKSRYELIRIKKKLERELERVKYNLKADISEK